MKNRNLYKSVSVISLFTVPSCSKEKRIANLSRGKITASISATFPIPNLKKTTVRTVQSAALVDNYSQVERYLIIKMTTRIYHKNISDWCTLIHLEAFRENLLIYSFSSVMSKLSASFPSCNVIANSHVFNGQACRKIANISGNSN